MRVSNASRRTLEVGRTLGAGHLARLFAVAVLLCGLGLSAVAQDAAPAAGTAPVSEAAPESVARTPADLAAERNTPLDHGPHYIESVIESVTGLKLDNFEYEILDVIMIAVTMLVCCLIIFGFINLFSLFAVWLERKVSAHMQCRLGPMEVGFHGVLQTIADGLKLVAKEDIIPRLASRPLFMMAPMVVFAGMLIRFVPLPFGPHAVASDMHLGLFFIAAVGSTEILGVIMAGWGSNNKWSLFATVRTVAQMVSYEIPIGIAFVAAILCCGSFSLVDIVVEQEGWFINWLMFRNPFMPILMLVYLIASLAECKRAPFDLPEAESELVSGFHTEYSGMRFGLFFLAEYGAMYLVSAIAVVLYMAGGGREFQRSTRWAPAPTTRWCSWAPGS